MSEKQTRAASTTPWAPYRPGPDTPWDVRRVVHLHRRAAFGATWNEIERDLADGAEASVARLIAGSGDSGALEGGRVSGPSDTNSDPLRSPGTPAPQPPSAPAPFFSLASV